MFENVRSTSCRPSENRSRRWVTLTMIAAMFGFAGLVFADGANNHAPKKAAVPKMVSDDPANPGDELPPANPAPPAPPANDKCAGAIELFLNISQKVNSVNALDDYHTPATAACYPSLPNGDGQDTQIPTTAPGRDVVFKFTAPAAGKYSVRLVVDGVTNDFRNQNGVLYLVDGPGCFGAGTVACLKGANRQMSRLFASSVGQVNNHGEEVNCVALAAGQTVYPVFDDFVANNAGSNPKIEVIPCVEESEPNDTTAQANAYQCEIIGATHVASVAHCVLGTKNGQLCRRTTPLDSSFAQTDLDCDPRCIGGPNNGLTCARTTPAIPNANTFCNPVTDVGAYCAGNCVIDQVCVGGPTPGVPCTATCNDGPRVGQYCSTAATTATGCGTGFLCIQNLSCGNGTTQNPGPGVCSNRFNEGDRDFFDLGNVPAGSKVFSAVDANTPNDMDWRMRITDSTNTLQFDDDDGNFVSGDFAPVIAGAIATGGPTYIEISHGVPRVAEPYHLNAIVRPPLASAQLESEFNANGINNTIYYYWPSNTIAAQPISNGANAGYIRGNFTAADTDCWKFCVNKGDLMHWYGDGNPLRTFPPTLAQLAQPIPYDSDGCGISNFIFGANARKNDLPTVPGAGLFNVTPAVTSSYETYRATYTGEIEVCMYEPSARVTPAPVPGYSPGAWAGSLGVNCGPVDDCTTIDADLEATKTISPGPYNDGDAVTYTITIINHGPGIAADVHVQDFLDPNTVFLSLEVKDGFDKDGDGAEGDNVGCFLLPSPGQNDAFIDCISGSIAPGDSVTYLLTVQVNNCVGPLDVFNSVTVDSRTPDPNATVCDVLNIFTGAIDTVQCENPSVSFSTTDDGSCQDLVCDDVSCTPNVCTVGDSCVDGVCEPGGLIGPVECDDDNLCTDDSCDPATGCVNDSSQLGDQCNNGGANKCLEDYCDPVTLCQVRDVNCDDSNACTDDSCDPLLGCVHTIHSCDDSNPCTDDSCDPASGCATTPHVCNDGDSCTNDSCDPASGCTTAPVNCDDGNPCTTDSCDSATGCTNVASGACHAQVTGSSSCSAYTSGASQDMTTASYVTKGTAINSSTPGVMYYFSTIIAPSASFAITVNQAIAPNSACSFPNWPPLDIQNNSQANLYSASCGNRSTTNSFDPTTGTLTMSVTGATPGETLVISVKYTVSRLKGTNVCRPHPIETYTFSDSSGNSDTLLLVPKN